MITPLVDRLRAVVLDPQTLEAVAEDVRVVVDTEGALLEAPQVVAIGASRTRPVAPVIGGRLLTVQHEVVVVVTIMLAQDDAETKRRRDAVTLDLVLRFYDADLDAGAWRTVAQTWDVDYAALGVTDTRNQYATVTFTVQQEREV